MRRFLTLAMAFCLFVGAARLTAQQAEVKPEHEKMKEAEGTWDAAVKSLGGESKGTLTCKMGLGGLWLMEHFKSEFAGKPFEGRGATTYDAAKQKYINVWFDSMSTQPMVTEGSYDKDTKTMTMLGNMPMPDGKSVKVTLSTTMKDANTKVFKIIGPGPEGKESEMLHITYKRRAK